MFSNQGLFWATMAFPWLPYNFFFGSMVPLKIVEFQLQQIEKQKKKQKSFYINCWLQKCYCLIFCFSILF